MKHSLRTLLHVIAMGIAVVQAIVRRPNKPTAFRQVALQRQRPQHSFGSLRPAGVRFAFCFLCLVLVTFWHSADAQEVAARSAHRSRQANVSRGSRQPQPYTFAPGTLKRGRSLPSKRPTGRTALGHLSHFSQLRSLLPGPPAQSNQGEHFLLGQPGSSIFPIDLSYASGGYVAESVAFGDFNGDGIPDMVSVNYCTDSSCGSGGNVSVRLGNGDGSFQPATTYSSGGSDPITVAVGDFNNDQILDLAVVNQCSAVDCTGSVAILLGNKDGTFQTAVPYATGGSRSWSVAVGDVNGDGNLDLVVTNPSDANVSVLLGNGQGNFGTATTYGSGGSLDYYVTIANLIPGGPPDLVVSNQCSIDTCTNGVVGVLLGGGDGTFQTAVPYLSTGLDTNTNVVADFNGDGNLDVAVVNYYADSNQSAGSVSIFLGKGDGTLQPATAVSIGSLFGYFLATGDFNADGHADLAVVDSGPCSAACSSGGALGVLLGKGDGSFQQLVAYPVGGLGPVFVASQDVNGDGKPDLVTANQCADVNCTEGTLSVLLGNGDGTFQSDPTYQTNAFGSFSVASGDFNGDGIPDLVVTNSCADSNCTTGSVSVYLGIGNGVYQAPVNYASTGIDSSSVAVGDFNGDHVLDLAVADRCSNSECTSGSVSILLGDGKGGFGAATQFLSGAQYSDSIAVGDFNKDGKLDLAVGNYTICGDGCQVGTVGVLLGNGDGSFQTATVYNSGGIQASSVAVADLNGDGYPDLAVANPCADVSCGSGGLVGILLNKGDGTGTFQPVVGYASGGFGAESLAIGDLNGDGKLDLAVANASAVPGNIGVLLGDGHGSFAPAQTFPVDGQPYSVAISDLNGDGIPDLAFTSDELCGSTGCDAFDGAVGALLGNGDGTFQSAVDYGQGALFGYSLIATDLNGDHKPDLAVVRDSSLTIFLNIVSGYRFGTTTTLMSSLNPAPQYQPVTFTATVSGPPGQGGIPTGDVTFYDGGAFLGTAPLNGGQPDQAMFTTSSLLVGNHSITANYPGDGNFLPSVSAPLIQVITPVMPTITVQPASQDINYGQTATLSVVAIGSPPLSYQWYLGLSGDTSNPIAGATNSSYTTPPLTATTNYWVQVSNAAGSVNSNTATIAVGPKITVQPMSQNIGYGQTATLSVVAVGSQPLSYQWYLGLSGDTSSPIAGATNSSYTTPPLTTTTSYWVQVSNVAGSVNSNTATIQVGPTITTQPASQIINYGKTATMTVVAAGTPPLSYQWYLGMSPNTSSPIAGATNSSYTTPALTTTTDYWVQVSNVEGNANSTTAIITVNPLPPPTITTEPASQNINSGQTATLVVVATGMPPLSYQWYQGMSPDTSNPIGGATGSSYTTPALTTTTDYWVQVSNAGVSANSTTAIITVNPPSSPPVITTQPVSQTIDSDHSATLTVSATGTLPLTYQWYQGKSGDTTTPVTGETGSSYTTEVLARTTPYWVNVTNSFGNAPSNTATITVNGPTCTMTITGGATGLDINATVQCKDSAATQTSIAWGDGTITPNVPATAPYTYKADGSYTVTATTTDTLGLVVTTSAIAKVTSSTGPQTTAGGSVQNPVTFSPNAGVTSPPTVTFVCSAVSGPKITGNVDPSTLNIGCQFPNPTEKLTSSVNFKVTITTKAPSSSLLFPRSRRLAPIYAGWLTLPGLAFLGLGYSGGRKKVSRYLVLALLAVLFMLWIGCGGGASTPPPPPPPPTNNGTPAGQYNMTVTDPIATGSTAPTGFQQTTVIVPFTVQ